MDLFNLPNEAILSEIEFLIGFIIGGHVFKNLKYADNNFLMSEKRNTSAGPPKLCRKGKLEERTYF